MPMELVNRLPYDHPYRWDGRAFGGPQLWRPSNLGSELALWLDAEDTASITINGSNVSAWANKGTGTWSAVQSTASLQPTYSASSINGKPALTFDGVDDFLTGGNNRMPPSDEHNIFVVYKSAVTPAGAVYGLVGAGSSQNNREFIALGSPSAPNNVYWGLANTPVGNEDVRVAGASTISSGYAAFVHTQFGASGFFLRENGSLLGSQNTSADPTQLGTANEFRIGQRFGTTWTSTMLGDIAEVIGTTTVLSTANRQRLEGYLAWKWGLEANLPSGHPFKNTPPTV